MKWNTEMRAVWEGMSFEEQAALEELEQRRRQVPPLPEGVRDLFADARDAEREAARSAEAKRSAHQRHRQERDYCIRRAAELWLDGPNIRMGEMSARLAAELKERGMFVPVNPRKRIAEWLRDAERDGHLSIPAAASQRGRPRRQQ